MPLEKKLKKFCDSKSYTIRFHFKNLKNGESFGREENIKTSAASVRKIAILMAALRAVNEGDFSLDQKIKIDKEFQKNRSGVLRHLISGFELSFENLLLLMIIISDNTATGHIVDLIGIGYINEYTNSLGLENTKVLHGFPPLGKEHFTEYTDTTSAREMSQLLEWILEGTKDAKIAQKLGCTPKLCDLGLSILKKQMYNTKLPYLLPRKTTNVAHKTGTRSKQGVFNDAGIIFYKKEPIFILSVFTHKDGGYLPDKSKVVFDIARISKMCFDEVIRK